MLTSLLFTTPSGNLCLVVPSAITDQIREETLNYHPHETGGILIGHYDDNQKVATVTNIFGPSDSKRELYTFERGTRGIKGALKRSGKLNHYLGEWHSHPNNSAFPSIVDICQMHQFALRKLYGIEVPILLVAGGKPHHNLTWNASIHFTNNTIISLEQL